MILVSLHGRSGCMHHDVQRRGLFRLDVLIDEEALAVWSDVVGEQVGGRDRRPRVDGKQVARRSRRKSSLGADLSFGQHLLWSDVEDGFAIATPARLGAATARNLPLAGSCRKRGYIDLPIA